MYDGYLGRTLIDLKLYARGTKWCRTTAWASDGVIEGPESSFGSSKKKFRIRDSNPGRVRERHT